MSLPGGYTELEYIQSSGTQYLDSGVTFEKTDTVEFEILWTVTPPSSGTYVGGNYYMQVGMGTSGYGIYAASNTKAYGTKDRMRVTFASVQETLLVNDAQVFTHDWSGQNLSNVKLGILKLGMEGNAWYSSAPVSAKVYSCTIKKGGALVRNFIPCKNASGVIGLWDDVNSVFYQNAGSGVFTAGPEVRGTHKTLIGGTAYDVKSGKCLINGTAYAIQKGRTLINGTGYDIALVTVKKHIIRMSSDRSNLNPKDSYVVVNGVTYDPYPINEIEAEGDVQVTVGIYAAMAGGTITLNGTAVKKVDGFTEGSYTFALDGDCDIVFKLVGVGNRVGFNCTITTT